jgi:hypothetical protein
MGSVGVRWSGSCLPGRQDELLSFLGRLADANDELLKANPPPANEFDLFNPAFMTPERKDTLRSRPNVERVDRRIAESIEIDSSIFADPREFAEGAEQLGLPMIGVSGPGAAEGPFVLNLSAPNARRTVRLRQASIYGINFKIFGAGYPWYPGEDRISFVFLHCPEMLFLDGRIVDIFHRTGSPGLIRFDTVQGADWYAQGPEIHLRYYLEDWTDSFFSWVKFFFVPNLQWWRYESLPRYPWFREQFEELQANAGAALARSAAFENILAAFLGEAAPIAESQDERRKQSAPHAGVRGRVLRTLRQSGDTELE